MEAFVVERNKERYDVLELVYTDPDGGEPSYLVGKPNKAPFIEQNLKDYTYVGLARNVGRTQ